MLFPQLSYANNQSLAPDMGLPLLDKTLTGMKDTYYKNLDATNALEIALAQMQTLDVDNQHLARVQQNVKKQLEQRAANNDWENQGMLVRDLTKSIAGDTGLARSGQQYKEYQDYLKRIQEATDKGDISPELGSFQAKMALDYYNKSGGVKIDPETGLASGNFKQYANLITDPKINDRIKDFVTGGYKGVSYDNGAIVVNTPNGQITKLSTGKSVSAEDVYKDIQDLILNDSSTKAYIDLQSKYNIHSKGLAPTAEGLRQLGLTDAQIEEGVKEIKTLYPNATTEQAYAALLETGSLNNIVHDYAKPWANRTAFSDISNVSILKGLDYIFNEASAEAQGKASGDAEGEQEAEKELLDVASSIRGGQVYPGSSPSTTYNMTFRPLDTPQGFVNGFENGTLSYNTLPKEVQKAFEEEILKGVSDAEKTRISSILQQARTGAPLNKTDNDKLNEALGSFYQNADSDTKEELTNYLKGIQNTVTKQHKIQDVTNEAWNTKAKTAFETQDDQIIYGLKSSENNTNYNLNRTKLSKYNAEGKVFYEYTNNYATSYDGTTPIGLHMGNLITTDKSIANKISEDLGVELKSETRKVKGVDTNVYVLQVGKRETFTPIDQSEINKKTNVKKSQMATKVDVSNQFDNYSELNRKLESSILTLPNNSSAGLDNPSINKNFEVPTESELKATISKVQKLANSSTIKENGLEVQVTPELKKALEAQIEYLNTVWNEYYNNNYSVINGNIINKQTNTSINPSDYYSPLFSLPQVLENLKTIE